MRRENLRLPRGLCPFIVSFLVAGLLSCAQLPEKPKQASRIPERRAFPVNPTISPCQDFYEYACSAVISDFKLPADRSIYTFAFDDSRERILDAKKQFLSELVAEGGEDDRQEALKNFYQACMNQEAAAREERENVARILDEVAAIKSPDQFQAYLQQRIDRGDHSFVGFITLANLTHNERQDVLFVPQMTSLPERSFYLREDVTADLVKLAEAVFAKVGLDNPEQRAQWVLEFEKKIKLSEPTPVQIRQLSVSPTIVARDRFLADYPALRVQRVLGRMPKDTEIRHWFPKTFEILNQALQQEDLRQLKAVYLYQTLVEYMDDAYPDIYQMQFDFRKKYFGGPEKRPDRQERCTRAVMGRLGRELDAELLPRLFPDFPEENIVNMTEEVREVLMQSINANVWLSEPAKLAAREKLKQAKLYLVKPHSPREWDFNPVIEYRDDAPYWNDLALSNALEDKAIEELYEPRNRERWGAPPLTVNAYFSPSDNKFVLFQGILQYPFFDPHSKDSANLGSGGMVVAHELGHAIDDQGSRFNAQGDAVEWMSKKDRKQFHRHGKSLIKQFDQAGYNGKLELGENIADLVGLSIAYRTAFPEERGSLEDKRAFFLQYARNWCTVIRPSALELLIKTNPHAPGKGRVNEQVKHQAGFQEAFECKADDPMTLPTKRRVKIW